MTDFAWGATLLDVTLSLLFAYLLIRISTSSDNYFHKSFYTFFVATGSCLIIKQFKIFIQALTVLSQSFHALQWLNLFLYRTYEAIQLLLYR